MESQTFCSFITKNTTVIWCWAPSSPSIYEIYKTEIQSAVVVCDLSDMLKGTIVLHWLEVFLPFLPSLTQLVMPSNLVMCTGSVRQWQSASEWWRRTDRSMLYPKLTENRNSAPLFCFFLHTPWTNTPLKERATYHCPTKYPITNGAPLQKGNKKFPKKIFWTLFLCYFGWSRKENKTLNKNRFIRILFQVKILLNGKRNLIFCYILVGVVGIRLKKKFLVNSLWQRNLSLRVQFLDEETLC